MRVAAKIVDVLLEADEVDPKSFVGARDANIEQYQPILVHGSYGTLKVDPNDGTVLRYDDAPEDDAAYKDIVKFDLEELRRWIKTHGSEEWASRDDLVVPGAEFDIVDVSFWTDTGEYVPGETEHRMMSWNDAEPG
jgi:hypothetical protein